MCLKTWHQYIPSASTAEFSMRRISKFKELEEKFKPPNYHEIAIHSEMGIK